MELLFVENVPGFGGSLTGILHLVDALPKWVQPTLLCPFDPNKFTDVPARLRIEIASIDGTRCQHQPSEGFARTLYRFARHNCWPWMREVQRVCRKYGTTLIHANNLVLGNFGAALAGARLGIPVISHQKGYEHNGRLVRSIIQQKWYAHHIATSHSIAEHLIELGVPADRCSMIYDAIIPPDPAPKRIVNDVPVVAMHSILRETKGQDVFLHAVAKVLARGGTPLRAVIAGAAPHESPYPDSLRRLAHELGIDEHVEFTGHLRRPFDLLARTDVSVHASVEPEPFGRVAAESMIMGVPVIAAADSGAAEYVETAQAGLSTPPRDVDALADAMIELLSSPARRAEMGGRGLQFAMEEFAPSVIAGQLVRLYEDVQRGAPPRDTLAAVRSTPALAR